MPEVVIDPRKSRAYTNGLLELIDSGLVDKDEIFNQMLCFLSESDVKQFCQLNLRDDDNECLVGPADDEDDED